MSTTLSDIRMRSSYWDGWKGVAILAVIAIHAYSGSGGFSYESPNWYFGLISRQLLNFAVPLFLALAGFFVSTRSTEFNYKRLMRILSPYLFWTLLTISFQAPSHLISMRELSKDVFLGQGIGIGYFVIVLIQFIILTPCINLIKTGWQHISAMLVISIVSMCLSYYFRLYQTESIFAKYPMYSITFFVWYPFYHLGIYVSRCTARDDNWFLNSTWSMLSLYFLFTILSLIEAIMLARKGYYGFAISQIKITSFLASISLFIFSVAYLKTHQFAIGNKYISWLGRYSYQIFLSHTLIFPAMRHVLMRSPLIYSTYPLYVLSCTLMTLAACIILIKISFYFPSAFQKICMGN